MNYPLPQGYPAAQQYPPAPPAQQFPPQPFQPTAPAQYPPQGYPQQFPPQYPAQGYPPYGAPQVPAQPAVNGTLDDYFNQPSTGGGPSISWKGKPEGTTYVGVVVRDVTSGDVQQQINFQTKQPEFYRDGRPKFVMKVPLRVAPSQEHPDGEAAFYVRGQARDELVRAMQEAGVEGAPRAGATITVQLVQRKPSGQGMNPSNVVAIHYAPAGTQPAQVQAPVQVPQQVQPPVQQFQQPVPQQAPVQQYAQPVPQQVAPQVQQPVQQYAQTVPQQAAPPVQQPQGLQMPADFDPGQAALLASITGQAQPQQ